MVHVFFEDNRDCYFTSKEIKKPESDKWLACTTTKFWKGCNAYDLDEVLWKDGDKNELHAYVDRENEYYHRVCIKKTDTDKRLNENGEAQDFLSQNRAFLKHEKFYTEDGNNNMNIILPDK
jgi:hypothetical protein